MGVVWTQQSEYAKEMRKWQAHHSEYGPPGRPYTYEPYPTRMYRCSRAADGTRGFDAETAHDEHEQRNLESRGYVVGGQEAALKALEKAEFRDAELAAERNFHERRMSEKAQAEAHAANEAAGARHLPVVPEKPKRKYTRKVKTASVNA